MTGIYNRGATQKLIESTLELRGDQEHALILCDIDDFKSVNDTFGHGIGDEAIKTVANLLSSVFDYDSVVGREAETSLWFCAGILTVIMRG